MRQLIERLERVNNGPLRESRVDDIEDTLSKANIDVNMLAQQLDHDNPIVHTRYFISNELEYVEELLAGLKQYEKHLTKVNNLLGNDNKADASRIAKIKKVADSLR